jgi:hypothetical protein
MTKKILRALELAKDQPVKVQRVPVTEEMSKAMQAYIKAFRDRHKLTKGRMTQPKLLVASFLLLSKKLEKETENLEKLKSKIKIGKR